MKPPMIDRPLGGARPARLASFAPRSRPRAGLLASVCVAAVTLGLAAPAMAQGKPGGKPAAAAPAIDAKAVQQKLKSGDPAKVAEGLAEAQAAGAGAASVAPAIEELLRKGTTAAAAKAGLEALGAIGAPSSSAVIRPYLGHRVADVRRAAVRALASTKGAEAAAGFKAGLRSGDGMVRGFSATGLGNLGQTDALPDLFLALDHGVTEAAAAVGQLCGPDECERYVGKLGKLGFDVMTSGLDPILFRQKALPEATLLKVVGAIRELGTPEAGRYLADVQGRWQASMSAKVKQAIDSAVGSIPGAKEGAK